MDHPCRSLQALYCWMHMHGVIGYEEPLTALTDVPEWLTVNVGPLASDVVDFDEVMAFRRFKERRL